MASENFQITGGPSKFDLMLALFDSKEVFFTLKGHGQFKTRIIALQNIDFDNPNHDLWGIRGIMYNKCEKGLDFSMGYNSRERKGEKGANPQDCTLEICFIAEGFLNLNYE